MKTVLITGGNGSIAKGIAKILVSTHRYLVLVPGREVLDVTNEDQISDYMYSRKPNILINCAGYINPSWVTNSDTNNIRMDMEVNYIGPYSCTKWALEEGCKTIINIGSTSGFEGRAKWSAYCSSKAALVAFTESLAKEGIEAYGIHPARTKSRMRERLFPGEDQSLLMEPERIGEFVLKALNGEFKSGEQIIVTKDNYKVLPMRICPK